MDATCYLLPKQHGLTHVKRAVKRIAVRVDISQGAASVTYWFWSEVQGRGDLRPYVIVQFLPMMIIPMLLLMYSGRHMLAAFLWATLLTYASAKVAEYYDPAIFEWLGFWSGHTVKHLLSALAVLWVVLSFRRQ